jgi:hypothetical protein
MQKFRKNYAPYLNTKTWKEHLNCGIVDASNSNTILFTGTELKTLTSEDKSNCILPIRKRELKNNVDNIQNEKMKILGGCDSIRRTNK